MILIVKEFSFEAAHFLPDYEGACGNTHGHSYRLKIAIGGKINEHGMIMDFKELKRIVKEEIVDKYDHKFLNNHFSNPTAELMVKKIGETLQNQFLPDIVWVKLWETRDSMAMWSKDE